MPSPLGFTISLESLYIDSVKVFILQVCSLFVNVLIYNYTRTVAKALASYLQLESTKLTL